MSIETAIVSALSATFSGRLFPDTAAADTVRPFCIYQQIGGQPVANFCGDALQKNARIQFWVWADTRSQANTSMAAVAAILTASPLLGTSQGGFVADYDDVTRTYGAMQDFSFWA